jgi:hypothetical protein
MKCNKFGIFMRFYVAMEIDFLTRVQEEEEKGND